MSRDRRFFNLNQSEIYKIDMIHHEFTQEGDEILVLRVNIENRERKILLPLNVAREYIKTDQVVVDLLQEISGHLCEIADQKQKRH